MTEADKALIRAALMRAKQRFDETCRPDLPCQFCRALEALDRLTKRKRK